MDYGLLRVTRAGASEPGWPVCVVTRVIVSSTCFRYPEPGLSDSEWAMPVASQLGPAWLWSAWPFEKKGGNIFRPRT